MSRFILMLNIGWVNQIIMGRVKVYSFAKEYIKNLYYKKKPTTRVGFILRSASYIKATSTKLSLKVVECPISPNSAELMQFTVPLLSCRQ